MPGRRCAVALVLLALLSVQIGWLLAVPAFHGIDEVDHIYRASSVARGHWEAGSVIPDDGRGHLISVPEDIVEAAREACATLEYVGPDNCSPTTRPDSSGEVRIASAAATYNPTWYMVVGSAGLPFDGQNAAVAMRLCAALLCDLLIAVALWLLFTRTASRWASIGVAVACTPVLVYSTVNAAPNGAGYCAGLLLWVSLLTLPRDATESVRGPLIGIAVSAPTIMATHSTGLLWVLMSFGCAGPLILPRVRHLWSRSRRNVVGIALLLAACATAAVTWVMLAGTNDPRAGDAGEYGPMPAKVLLQGLVLWPLQSIATLQTRNTAAPIEVYTIGVALLAVVVLLAWRVGRRAERLSIVMVAVASLVIPLAATALTYPKLAAAWQGRYGLALSLGIIILATSALARSRAPRTTYCWILAIVWTTLHWMTITALFRKDFADNAQPWTPWFVAGAALVTVTALGMAFSRPRPANLRR